MQRIVTCCFLILVMAACSKKSSSNEDGLGMNDSKKAWHECKFELAKIEAIRGRNLDDLNHGYSVARNQFLMDCMASKNLAWSYDELSDMSNYAAKKDRTALEMSLNRSGFSGNK